MMMNFHIPFMGNLYMKFQTVIISH